MALDVDKAWVVLGVGHVQQGVDVQPRQYKQASIMILTQESNTGTYSVAKIIKFVNEVGIIIFKEIS